MHAGTTNFVHRFPFVCVSIGLSVDAEPVLGVVYNPILGELFTAVKGRGSLLNGEPRAAVFARCKLPISCLPWAEA